MVKALPDQLAREANDVSAADWRYEHVSCFFFSTDWIYLPGIYTIKDNFHWKRLFSRQRSV